MYTYVLHVVCIVSEFLSIKWLLYCCCLYITDGWSALIGTQNSLLLPLTPFSR